MQKFRFVMFSQISSILALRLGWKLLIENKKNDLRIMFQFNGAIGVERAKATFSNTDVIAILKDT